MTINLPQLLEELNSDDIETYLAAQDQIRANQKAVLPSLIDLMLTQTNRRAWRAAALAASMKEASTVPAFIQALDSPNALIRQTAAQVLGDLGDETVVPHLIARLYDETSERADLAGRVARQAAGSACGQPLSVLDHRSGSPPSFSTALLKLSAKLATRDLRRCFAVFFDSPDHHVCKRAHEVYQQLTTHP